MSTSDVLAVVAATVVTILVVALAGVLVVLASTLRDLRATVTAMRDEALPLLEDARDAVRDAAGEVDRVERLVTSAERLSDAVDGVSKRAARSVASPVVKAMAFGSGVSRAAQRLRDGEPAPRTAHAGVAKGRRRRRKAS